jgi:hypothetical protein
VAAMPDTNGAAGADGNAAGLMSLTAFKSERPSTHSSLESAATTSNVM